MKQSENPSKTLRILKLMPRWVKIEELLKHSKIAELNYNPRKPNQKLTFKIILIKSYEKINFRHKIKFII